VIGVPPETDAGSASAATVNTIADFNGAVSDLQQALRDGEKNLKGLQPPENARAANKQLAQAFGDLADALEPVPRAERPAVVAAQALDLPRRNDAPVCGIALDADPPLPVPATERVEADSESAGSLTGGVRACHEAATLLHMHYLGKSHKRRRITAR